MPRRSDSRDRMIRAAARLFRRDGYAATGWRKIVDVAEAPWGSQAHNFPNGKEELAVEAIRYSGDRYRALLGEAFRSSPPVAAVTGWLHVAAAELEESGWTKGCPVATVSLETSHDSPALAAAAHAVFQGWRDEVAAGFVQHGFDPEQARRLALVVVAAVEGGLLLARSARSREPLDTLADALAEQLPAV